MDPETFDPEDTFDPITVTDSGRPIPTPHPKNGLMLFVWDDDKGLWNRARFSDLSPPLARRLALLTSKGLIEEGLDGAVIE